jgi:hypothetical protein
MLMRCATLLACLVVALGATEKASAGSWWFSSSGPLQYQVVDTSNVAAPIAQPQNISGRTGFKLSNYIPSFVGVSNARNYGASNFPTASQLPAGDYLKPFNLSMPGR